MISNEIKSETMMANETLYDGLTDNEWDEMYKKYIQEYGGQDLPDTYEWGLY